MEQLAAVGAQLKRLINRLWIGLGLFHDGQDLSKTANALTLSTTLALPIVAVNDVHTHCPERQGLQNIVTAIRLKTDIQNLGYQGFCNAERTLRPITTLQQLYPEEMLAQTIAIADLCQFSMEELRYEYPEDLVPPHLTPRTYLRQLTYDGASQRWPQGIPKDTVTLIEKELDLIAQLRYEALFSDRTRHRAVCPQPAHFVSGPGVCRQLCRMLLPVYYRSGSCTNAPAV